jgi:predicted Fe-Mo cluster-binding NifX family protein
VIHKITITVHQDHIAPRFDLATEILIIMISNNSVVEEKKSIVLPRSSADELCHLLLSENINTLICGAIEDEYYQFLKWKKIDIFDSIVGNWTAAFKNWQENTLASGDILSHRMVEGKRV